MGELGPWVNTHTGKKFYILNPHMNVIDPVDIAWSLSNLCRFNGHTTQFYSVAQHSLLVAAEVPEKFRLEGLLHDAAEAYTGDVISPLKTILRARGGFASVEAEIEFAICNRFGIPHRSPEVKDADLRVLAAEIRDLTFPGAMWQEDLPKPITETIIPWSPQMARMEWLRVFNELKGE